MKKKKGLSQEYVDYEQIEIMQKGLDKLVNEVLDAHTKDILDYRGGVRSSLDRLVSEVMRKSGGRADPKKIRDMIINKL